jgi:hypothetical protein
MFPFTLPEQAVLVGVMPPATDAAGRTGDYISLKHLHRAFVVFFINQGHATVVPCSISKATGVTPAGATAMTELVPIWTSLDQTAGHQFTRQPNAASFSTDAALKPKIVIFEIVPGSLGETYDCIAPVTAASNVGNITSALIYGVPRIAGRETPDVLTD